MENENTVTTPQDNPLQRESKLRRFCSSNAYIFLSFGLSALIMTFVYFIYKMVPFGDITILRMDLYHQYGPLFSELYTRLTEGKSMVYSWYTGLGGSFLGNFFNYLSSPLSFLIVLFGSANITEAISFFILVKSALSAAFFCFFLKKSFGKQGFGEVAFSILYSMCGYFLAYYWNVMWLDGMVLLPLIIVGLQAVIRERKWILYTVSFAALMFANYYIAMMVCIVCVLYFVAYFFSTYSAEQDGVGKLFVNRGVTFALSSLLAGGLGAAALLPTYFALQSSSATGGTFPKDFKIYFNFFDFLANHLAAVTPTIRSSGDDVMPNVYCGVVVLILIPLYLFAKSISKKEKLCSIALLGVLYISFNFNMLNYIWHGMHFPNDLPYRFSFVYSFVLLTMAYNAFRHLKDFTMKEIGISVLGVLAFIMTVEKLGSKNVTDNTVIISVVFVILYALILLIYKSKKLTKRAFTGFFLIAVFLELTVATPDLYNIDQPKSNYASDKPIVTAVIDKIHNDDPGFYRLEISDSRTHNDPAWYGYNGISTFSSMAHEKAAYLSDQLGLDTNRINSYRYRSQTPVFNAMFNLKYLLSKNMINDPDLYTIKFASGQYYVYENNYTLPVAFAVDDGIGDWDILSSDPFDIQNGFVRKATGDPSLNPLTQLEVISAEGSNCSLSNTSNSMGTQSFTVNDSAQTATITFYLKTAPNQHAYLYVKSGEISSVSIKSSQTEDTKEISEAYVIDMGYYAASETIEVSLSTKGSQSGSMVFYAYGTNAGEMKKVYDRLSPGGLNVTHFAETELSGDITVQKDGVLYTSIPYDEGWSCTVDGQSAKLVSVGDALCGFKISAGQHHVELKYTARGLQLGLIISCASLLLLVLFVLLGKRTKKAVPAIADESTDDAEIEAETEIAVEAETNAETKSPEASYNDEMERVRALLNDLESSSKQSEDGKNENQ